MGTNKGNVAEWFELAERDLDTAKLLLEMRPQHYEIICYHCEQAAEKYLKGYILSGDEMPPKTHDLDTLCELCAKNDMSFDDISDECTYLSQFAVHPRYPYDMGLNEHNTQTALGYAEAISTFKAIDNLRIEIADETTEEPE
jgi:HEPN domain-containing protein